MSNCIIKPFYQIENGFILFIIFIYYFMIRLILYILFFLIILSCKDPVIDRRNDFQVVVSDSVIIPISDNKFSKYHTLAIYQDSLLYGVNIAKRNVIDVYNIKQQRYTYTIEVDNKMLTDRITGLFISSPDSIYFCLGSPNAIYLINNLGTVLQSWKAEKLIINKKTNKNLSNINFSTFLSPYKPIVINDLCYIPIDPLQLYKNGNDLERVGCYNLKKNSWDTFFASTGDIEVNLKSKDYPFDMEQPYILVVDSLFIVSYPVDHNIYCYSLKSKKMIKKVSGRSVYMPKIFEPLVKGTEGCQKLWNYRVQTPFYGPLFYHEKEKKYTRIVHHKQPLINSAGNINDGLERDASILILNSDLIAVGETLFHNGEIGVYSYLPLKDGILVGKQSESENQKYLEYNKVLKIIPVDKNK